MDPLRTSILCIAYAALTNAQASISLDPPTAAGTAGNVSQIISPSFAGLGIEPSNLLSFTGTTHTNQLSINLMNNLAGYTGAAPHLRIGGNTADNMLWDASLTGFEYMTNPNPVGVGQIPSDMYFFGPGYLQALDRFPKNTPVTFGLNMAYQQSDYLYQIVQSAGAVLNYTNNVNIFSFEIGNEPDLYLQNGFRNGTWNNYVYGQQWADRADAVYQDVLKPQGISTDFFEGACTASTIGTPFEIVQLLRTEMVAAVNGTSSTVDTYLSGWNQHDYFYYIGVSGYNLVLDFLMDLSQTPTQFAAWATQQQQAQTSGKNYYLREMASVGPVGEAGISDVFGATLWTLNFFLYTASINVTNVNMHMTDNSFAAPWQPIEIYGMGPYVRTTYYAWVAFDQLIGSGCAARVAPMDIAFPEDYANRLGAYATYKNDRLSSVVVLNTLMANITQPKNEVTVTLSLPDFANQTLYLSYLTAAGADARFNTTFNGLSFEITGNGLPTVVNSTVPTVQIGADGSVSFQVRDSQAVIANIGYQVGTGGTPSYAASACAALVTAEVSMASMQPIGAPSYYVSTASVAIPTVTTQVGADANGATASASAASASGTARAAASSTSSSKGAAAPVATIMPKAALVGMAAVAGGMVAFA